MSQTNRCMGASVPIQNPDIKETQDSVTMDLRMGSNNDPMTLKFYNMMWKVILNHAKLLSCLDAVIGNTFPERHVYSSQKACEFITQAITELKEDGMQPDESFLRKHQCHMGDLHWDLEPSNFDNPQQLAHHVLELYNDLMEGTKYIHGNCDEEGKFDNFLSMVLRDLCMMGYYIGKSSLAASFPDVFSKNLPTGALAFATTALTAGVDEYATGAFAAVKFHHKDYSKVNKQFLDIISNIKSVLHHLQSLERVLKNIAIQGCVKNPTISPGVVSASEWHNFTAHLD
ncbi:hypothetical protein EDC04DRAFT_2900597 [Pisolithus marmoratus]|nr:hypothetical protein EDC04DRAFT_2900597 [Pisolithus marmoratus]